MPSHTGSKKEGSRAVLTQLAHLGFHARDFTHEGSHFVVAQHAVVLWVHLPEVRPHHGLCVLEGCDVMNDEGCSSID